MFSIIIPLYNKEQSVKNTIQSVLNQTFGDYEIIIVNDGSTDNSLEVVKQIRDERIRIIDKANGGVSSARNRGIDEARYEWICFLDADDLWVKEHLEEYYKVIKENDICWIISGFTSIRYVKKWINIYSKHGILENVFIDLLKGLSIHTSSVCIKRELFKKHKDLYFREGLNNSEDREVWYKLCCVDNKPFYIKKALAFYDLGIGNSLSKQSVIIKGFPFLNMRERVEPFFKYTNTHNIELFSKFLKKYNIGQIKNNYIKGNWTNEFKNHIGYISFIFFEKTIKLPVILKKIIVKISYYFN